MLCAPLHCQYEELPSSASDAVLYTALLCKMWVIKPNIKQKTTLDGEHRNNIINNLCNNMRKLQTVFKPFASKLLFNVKQSYYSQQE